MLGYAVVNGGEGTLEYLVANGGGDYKNLMTARTDVKVHGFGGRRYHVNLRPGLGTDATRMGPELGFGTALGDKFDFVGRHKPHGRFSTSQFRRYGGPILQIYAALHHPRAGRATVTVSNQWHGMASGVERYP
jgi:hypothetical protein